MKFLASHQVGMCIHITWIFQHPSGSLCGRGKRFHIVNSHCDDCVMGTYMVCKRTLYLQHHPVLHRNSIRLHGSAHRDICMYRLVHKHIHIDIYIVRIYVNTFWLLYAGNVKKIENVKFAALLRRQHSSSDYPWKRFAQGVCKSSSGCLIFNIKHQIDFQLWRVIGNAYNIHSSPTS